MSWPINSKSKDSGGIYSKVRTFDDNDVPKALGNGGTGPNYSTGALGPTMGSKNNAYAHAHVLQALEARQAEQNSGLSMLDTSVNRLGELSLGISR